MTDSKSVAFGRGGSSPPTGTTFYNPDRIGRGFFMPEIQGNIRKQCGVGLEPHAGRGADVS